LALAPRSGAGRGIQRESSGFLILVNMLGVASGKIVLSVLMVRQYVIFAISKYFLKSGVIIMSNLRVFDPFSVDTLSADNFDEMFRNLFRGTRGEGFPTAPQIRMDVDESPQAYQVKAELPGVKKEDIQVNIDGNFVSINAEIKREKEDRKDGKLLRAERYYGSVSRAFTLADEVDDAKVDARFENGVLNLTLPKKASTQAKRIAIH
jgi:HSP20 family protein